MRVMLAAALLVSSIGLAFAALPGGKHPHPPPVAASAAPVMTRLEVKDVIPLTSFHQAAVILSPEGGELIVPVLVGEADGEALSAQLKDSDGSTATTLRQALKGSGGKVVRVELTELQGETVKARVVMDRDGKAVAVEGEAAPSLSLALAAGAPVMASKQVVDGLGLTKSQIRDMVESGPGHLSGSGAGSPSAPEPGSAPTPGTISL